MRRPKGWVSSIKNCSWPWSFPAATRGLLHFLLLVFSRFLLVLGKGSTNSFKVDQAKQDADSFFSFFFPRKSTDLRWDRWLGFWCPLWRGRRGWDQGLRVHRDFHLRAAMLRGTRAWSVCGAVAGRKHPAPCLVWGTKATRKSYHLGSPGF